jgi:hypothetical protein
MAQPVQSLSYQLDELYLQYLIEQAYQVENPDGKCVFIASSKSRLYRCGMLLFLFQVRLLIAI